MAYQLRLSGLLKPRKTQTPTDYKGQKLSL